MADEEYGAGGTLGEVLELCRALLELGDGACRRLQKFALHRLDGIHDEDVGLQSLYVLENLLGIGFGEDIAVGGGLTRETRGAHLELRLALLTGDVEHFLTA